MQETPFERSSRLSRVHSARFHQDQQAATTREVTKLKASPAWLARQKLHDLYGEVIGNWQATWRANRAQVEPMPEFQVDDDGGQTEVDDLARQRHQTEWSSQSTGNDFARSGKSLPPPVPVRWRITAHLCEILVSVPLVFVCFLLVFPAVFLLVAQVYLLTTSRRGLGHALFSFRCLSEETGKPASFGLMVVWWLLASVLSGIDPSYILFSSKHRTLSERLLAIRVVYDVDCQQMINSKRD